MFAKEIALRSIMISLVDECSNLFTLAADLILLCCESLFELYLVALAISKTARGVAVCFALFGLTARSRFEIHDAWY